MRMRRRAKAIAVIIGGVVFALALLLVILNIENPTSKRAQQPNAEQFDSVTELIPDLHSGSQQSPARMNNLGSEVGVELPEGGWIQTTDDAGRLEQQYKFDQANPLPDGWFDMRRPRAEFYFDDDRVVTLEGDAAHAHAPHRALSEGRIEGDVVIRMFEHVTQRPFDANRHTPSLEVRTAKAEFDNLSGEIFCEGDVDIQTPQAHVPGRRLRILVNDQLGRIERMTMDQVGEIRLIGTDTQLHAAARRPAPRQSPSTMLANFRQNRGERETRNPRKRGGESRTPTSADEPQFYVLTLRDDVHIVEGEFETGRRAEGDSLRVVFSMQSAGDEMSGQQTAASSTNPRAETAHDFDRIAPLSMRDTLIFAMIASYQDSGGLFQPGIDDVVTTITCAGGMLMEPAVEPADILDHERDTRIDLIGEPVRMFDPGESFYGECGKAVIHRPRDKFELIASPNSPVLIDSPQLAAGADHFFLDDSMNSGGFIGPGWMRPREQPSIAVASAASSSSALALQDAGESSATPVEPPPGGFIEKSDPIERLHIEWTDSVDLSFTQPASDGEKPSLRAIDFKGNVLVESKGEDPGIIMAQHLQMELQPDAAGKAVPTKMIADGDVKTKDSQLTMWSNDLLVTFREIAATASEPTATESEEQATSILGDNTDIDTVLATGDVQVLLADGSRVFCNQLDGDATEELLTMTGDNVVVVSDQMIMDRGTSLFINRKTGKVLGKGAGQVRIFDQSIDVSEDRRIEPPFTDEPAPQPQLQARWNESMEIDGEFNDGGGAIDFTGEVEAESRKTPRQRDTIAGHSLRLEFIKSQPAPSAAESSTVDQPAPSDDAIARGDDRRLAALIARGSDEQPAKMESRVWEPDQMIESASELEPDPDAKPRVYYIEGPHIEHNNLTGESLVDGPGKLLMRDLRPPQAGDRTAGQPSGTSPFSSRGTSLFAWSKRLEMKRSFDDQYDVVMTGGVEILHRDLAEQISTLTGDELDVTTVVMPVRGEDASGERMHTSQAAPVADVVSPPPASALAFGGAMSIQRIQGRGNLLINTPSREVICDSFDYNEASKLAEVSAARGRMVSIKTRGSASPAQASKVLWDMRRDSISIKELGAGG